MSGRLLEVFIPLGTDGPSWRLEPAGADWRLGDWDELYRSPLLEPMPELPPLVPMASRPAPLQSIDGEPIASGVAVPWDTWTPIRDASGAYLERFSRGSLARTLQQRDYPVSSMFMHGTDSSVGLKSLGPLALWEGAQGLEYELAFLNVPYARDISAGVRAGVYAGASVRFGTVRDQIDRRPARSEANPRGIPQVTVLEAYLVEVSIVSRPAYPNTSAVIAA